MVSAFRTGGSIIKDGMNFGSLLGSIQCPGEIL